MLNYIFCELDDTLIVTKEGGQMLLLESKIWKDLSNPLGFLTFTNNCSILFFLWRKRDNLLFLTSTSDRSRTKDENINYIRLSIIRGHRPNLNQWNQLTNVFSLNYNVSQIELYLNIPKYPFSWFPMAFMGCLHIPRNKTNKKIIELYSNTLKYPFNVFPMYFMGCFHIPRNKTNKKGNIRTHMIQIYEATN